MTLSENAELRNEAPHPLIGTHAAHVANRLNWLRAGVLGANNRNRVDGRPRGGSGCGNDGRLGYLRRRAGGSGRGRGVDRSSAVAFTLGAVVPLIAILLPPTALRVPLAFSAVLMALAVTGTVSAVLGGAQKRRAVLRVVLGGALAMLVTYGVGQIVGIAI